MVKGSLRRWALVVGLGLVCPMTAGGVAAATVPVAVSPGGVESVLLVRLDCPTFSWSAVPGATGYELLVFPLEGAEPAVEPVIHELLPATSWTPAVGHCLEPGASYGWSVRSVGPEGPGPWAEGRYFEVDTPDPLGRIEEAVRAVLSALAAEGRLSEAEAHGLERLARQAAATEAPVRPAAGGDSPHLGTRSLAGAAAAIRGKLEAISGEAYGVIGISHSPDGAGLAAENTAGGPDLVLAGDPPALLSEAGLVRESSATVAFDFSNPGAGAMVVTVDGVPLLTESAGGTITEVVAGTGLTGGGTSGAVTLGVVFAGSGSAATASRSDHHHDDDYAPLVHQHFGDTWTSSASVGLGVTNSGGTGLRGQATGEGGLSYGVDGRTTSTSGRGVTGRAVATSGTNFGVHGQSSSTQGRGVYGLALATSGLNYGVYGETSSTQGWGVHGEATATDGLPIGVRGDTNAPSGRGVYGEATATDGFATGVRGDSWSTLGRGVFGQASASSGQSTGVYGVSYSTQGGRGVYGEADTTSGTNYGVFGVSWSAGGYAGWFQGRLHATGEISAGGTKSFKIDHPLDPENQYLYHFALESDEVLNFYNGNVVLDASGETWVELPEWFAAINRDFRYQLTAIGLPGPNLHVAQKIEGGRFKIGGGEPAMEVSWTVTAQRADPWVRDHAPQVEVEKAEEERGRYLYPAGYGQSEERGLHWEMHEQNRRAIEEAPTHEVALGLGPEGEPLDEG